MPESRLYSPALWAHHYPPDALAGPGRESGLRNAADCLRNAAARFPDRVHLRHGSQRLTYAETQQLTDRLAAGLAADGIRPGDRVGLLMPNIPAHALAVLAVWRAGAISVGLNPLSSPADLTRQANDAGLSMIIAADRPELLETARRLRSSAEVAHLIVCDADGADLFEAAKPAAGSTQPADAARIVRPGTSPACGVSRPHVESPSRSGPEPAYPSDSRTSRLNRLLDTGSPVPHGRESSPGDVASLCYTGGTTGEPKGAMLTHANFLAAARQMRRFYGSLEDGGEVFLAAAPFTHIGGLQNTLNLPTSIAAEICIVERFRPAEIMALVETHRITFLLTVPTMLVAFAREPGFAAVDWSSVRFVVAGGAPLPPEVRRRFERRTGTRVRNGYGMTETTGVAAIMPADPRDHENDDPDNDRRDGPNDDRADAPGVRRGDGRGEDGRSGKAGDDSDSAAATGVPLPEVELEIRAVDDVERPLPLGETGEIVIAGPQVMAGYWNRPEETRAAFAGEFLRTGDLGYVDGAGFLHLVDRLKDLIIAGGYNVYPGKVERAIYEHPAVAEALVVGVPDDYRGETVRAVVSLRDDGELTLEDLQRFLRPALSPVEIPKQLEIRDSLPRTPAGKLSRHALRKEIGGRDGAAAGGSALPCA